MININKILNMLFIKDYDINKYAFRNLFYSSNNSCFSGFDINMISENKLYNEYKILKEINNPIGEEHIEYKAFIKLDINYFIRILIDNDELVYDILIYKINNEDEYNKYDKIFFTNKIIIPPNLDKLITPIIYVDNKIEIIKNVSLFSSYLGYEDWDYKNKCLNRLDISSLDDMISDFKNEDFIKAYRFKCNDDSIIKLELEFKYIDSFYIISNIKRV